MTLADLIPTLRGSLRARLEPGVWPRSAQLTEHDLTVGGVSLTSLAAAFGTPCQVIDEEHVRVRAREFRAALPEAEIVYASKALSCRAVLRWIAGEGLSVDVSSAGELAVARSAGVPGERILMHGNVKTPEDLKAALAYRVSRVAVDSFDEITALGAVAHNQQVLIRVTPGIDAHTHAAINTAVEDQKFGFSLTSGAAAQAVERVLAQPSLTLTGLHCHIGSQITRVAGFEEAARRMVGLLAEIRDEHGITLGQLDLGGGFAARYLPTDAEFDLAGYANRLRVALHYECERHHLPLPRLVIEPGRAIVANAGVTLYRVITVKHGPLRTFVAVDGGMSDNPRPALYGARYTTRLVGRDSPAPHTPVTVAGRHCEAGDVLATDVLMPNDIHAGDLIVMPGAGAYHHSLASNYNQVGRPPLVAVANGAYRLIVRGETEEDLLSRDVG